MANSLFRVHFLVLLLLIASLSTAADGGAVASFSPSATHTYSPALFATVVSTLGFQKLYTATAKLSAITPLTIFLQALTYGSKIETLSPNRCLTTTEDNVFVNGVETSTHSQIPVVDRMTSQRVASPPRLRATDFVELSDLKSMAILELDDSAILNRLTVSTIVRKYGKLTSYLVGGGRMKIKKVKISTTSPNLHVHLPYDSAEIGRSMCHHFGRESGTACVVDAHEVPAGGLVLDADSDSYKEPPENYEDNSDNGEPGTPESQENADYGDEPDDNNDGIGGGAGSGGDDHDGNGGEDNRPPKGDSDEEEDEEEEPEVKDEQDKQDKADLDQWRLEMKAEKEEAERKQKQAAQAHAPAQPAQEGAQPAQPGQEEAHGPAQPAQEGAQAHLPAEPAQEGAQAHGAQPTTHKRKPAHPGEASAPHKKRG